MTRSSNWLGTVAVILVIVVLLKFFLGLVFGLIRLIVTVAVLAGLAYAVLWFYQKRRRNQT
ncbi:MAG TPA: hypothetical protein VGO93_14915 [Candidatus Xenobia bacterium]|jgi:hypothetical protein